MVIEKFNLQAWLLILGNCDFQQEAHTPTETRTHHHAICQKLHHVRTQGKLHLCKIHTNQIELTFTCFSLHYFPIHLSSKWSQSNTIWLQNIYSLHMRSAKSYIMSEQQGNVFMYYAHKIQDRINIYLFFPCTNSSDFQIDPEAITIW